MDESELFVVVYDRLRALAQSRLEQLPPGNTLQATALVHEVYLRLGGDESDGWNSTAHFFGAAAQAMRQILVEQARSKASLKRGGASGRAELPTEGLEGVLTVEPEVLLTIDEALDRLEERDAELAEIVKLRYFSGLPMTEIAAVLEVPRRTLNRRWRFAAAHLRRALVECGHEAATAQVDGLQ